MHRLDRHLVKQFVRATLFALLAFSVIFILIDMVEKVDDFIDENVPAHVIGLYYAYFLPRIFNLMVPVAMLLAALFVIGNMSNRNELTIIKCSGVSLYRFMAPLLVVGMFACGGLLVFDGWLVPRINALRLNLERVYLKRSLQTNMRYNLYVQDRRNRVVSLEYYDENQRSARRVSLQEFDSADPTKLVRRWDAASMRWDPAREEWMMLKGVKREFSRGRDQAAKGMEKVVMFDSLDIGTLVINPTIILRMQQKPEEMELGDFHEYIQRQRIAGSDVARLEVDYQGKIAFPFSSLIVILFAVPFASVKRRSGLSVQFGISVLICFTYLVGQKISQVFGYNGSISPLLASWIPNILFLLTGLTVMLRVRK
jgi:lipopolysaccharide export system permease protein